MSLQIKVLRTSYYLKKNDNKGQWNTTLQKQKPFENRSWYFMSKGIGCAKTNTPMLMISVANVINSYMLSRECVHHIIRFQVSRSCFIMKLWVAEKQNCGWFFRMTVHKINDLIIHYLNKDEHIVNSFKYTTDWNRVKRVMCFCYFNQTHANIKCSSYEQE